MGVRKVEYNTNCQGWEHWWVSTGIRSRSSVTSRQTINQYPLRPPCPNPSPCLDRLLRAPVASVSECCSTPVWRSILSWRHGQYQPSVPAALLARCACERARVCGCSPPGVAPCDGVHPAGAVRHDCANLRLPGQRRGSVSELLSIVCLVLHSFVAGFAYSSTGNTSSTMA